MHNQNTFEQIFERIQSVTNCRTQVQLAKLLGIKQSSISDAKKRDHVPAEWLLKLYRAMGLNPNWIEFGDEPIYLKDEPRGQQPAHAELSSPKKSCPIYKVSGISSDNNRTVFDLVSELTLPSRLQRDSIAMFIVDSNAMSPMIRSGAIIGIDANCKRIRSGEIYAFDIPYEGFTVRRAFYSHSDNIIALRADLYPDQKQILGIEPVNYDVLGIVRFVMQEI